MAVTFIKPKKHPINGITKYPWEKVYNLFIERNLAQDGSSYSLKDAAKEFSIPWQTVRDRAAKDNWGKKLKALRAERDTVVKGQLVSREAINEITIRLKHAGYAREITEKAMVKLRMIPPSYLSIWQAIKLLDMGVTAERKALGMPDEFKVDMTTTSLSKAQEDFEKARVSNRRVEAAVVKALSMITDVEFTEVPTDARIGR